MKTQTAAHGWRHWHFFQDVWKNIIVSRNGMEPPVIMEFKIAKERRLMESSAEEALGQIIEKHYDAPFEVDGYEKCIHIGISFYNKTCWVKCQTLILPVQK